MLTVLGKALAGIGQTDRARACWQEALAIHEQLKTVEADEVRALLSPVAAV